MARRPTLVVFVGGLGGSPVEEMVAGACRAVSHLEAPHRLLQGLGEGAADCHHLADAAHRGAEGIVGVGELGEVEAGELDHHIVERRLEGGRGPAGDVVGDLVEGEPDCQQRGDLGDREAGGLGGERG